MITANDVQLIEDTSLVIPEEFLSYPKGATEDWSKRFRRWLSDNGVYYYAKPKERFSMVEARQLAASTGRVILLTEDLS